MSTRQRIFELVVCAAWILGLRAALQLLGLVLGSADLAQAAVGALVVDLAAGRAGIAWTTDGAERVVLAGRLARSAGITAAVALTALAVCAVAGFAQLSAGAPEPVMVLSVLALAASAIRDELLFRALPLHFAARAQVPEQYALGFAALLSATPFLLAGASLASVVLACASGLLFASIYARFRGVWPAIVAHAVWSVCLGPVARGLVVETTWTGHGEIAEGAAAAGTPAWLLSGLAVAAALFVVPRASRYIARVGSLRAEPALREAPPEASEKPRPRKPKARPTNAD